MNTLLQFGADYADDAHGVRNFKFNFLKHLKNVCVIYPQANVEEGKRGLALKPSPPHVAAFPESKQPVERRHYAMVLPAPAPAPTALLLKTATYEKARQAVPGLDVYALEQDWREWIAKTGKLPENPDAAFIGFCKQKAKQHGQV